MLLERLHALATQPVSAQGLHDIQQALITVEPDLRRRRHLPVPGNEAGRVRELSEEIGTYCYFLACVLRFFDNRLNEALLTRALHQGWVDNLAHALRSQSMNTALARTALDAFLRNIGREFGPPTNPP